MNATITHYFRGVIYARWTTVYRECPFGWDYDLSGPLACNESIRLWVFD